MMKARSRVLALMLVLVTCAGTALAGGKGMDIGQREYATNCMSCHGAGGKGDGPVAKALRMPVPDLTTISRDNGGVFPYARVYESIDGRHQLAAHGTRDMPVWGRDYQVEGYPVHDDYPYNPESFVIGRILSLIEYIYRIQVK